MTRLHVRSRRCLIVVVDERLFAVPVASVREIVRMVEITPVPEAPRWVAGSIGYRGTVAPVVDGRVRIGARPAPYALSTPIVVIDGEEGAYGLVVDDIDDVRALDLEPGAMIQDPAAPFVSDAALTADGVVLVLDPDTLLDPSVAVLVQGAARPPMEPGQMRPR